MTVHEVTLHAIEIAKQLGLYGKDPWLLATLGISCLSLLLTLRNRRMIRGLGGGEVGRMQSKLERLDVHVQDVTAKIQTEQHRLKEAVLKLSPENALPEPPVATKKKSEPASPRLEAPADDVLGDSGETKSFFTGLRKTRSQFFSRLSGILRGKKEIDTQTYQELEELLITGDLGVRTAHRLLDRLKTESAQGTQGLETDEASLRQLLKTAIFEILDSETSPEILPVRAAGGLPQIILVVGVNGVGKTTTIGKLSSRFKNQGAKVLVAACDTFRAAAVEQMQAWGRRSGVDVVAGDEQAKPTTVAYQALQKARDEGYDVLLVDTAGRLHTRVNLMNELVNVIRIIEREQPGSPHETILVLDASTGQNALQQAREFHEKTNLTGIVITKLDGTPKGGIVVAIKDELGIPIRYIGVGEGVEDLRPFSATEFVDALFADDSSDGDGASSEPVQRARRERAVF